MSLAEDLKRAMEDIKDIEDRLDEIDLDIEKVNERQERKETQIPDCATVENTVTVENASAKELQIMKAEVINLRASVEKAIQDQNLLDKIVDIQAKKTAALEKAIRDQAVQNKKIESILRAIADDTLGIPDTNYLWGRYQ